MSSVILELPATAPSRRQDPPHLPLARRRRNLAKVAMSILAEHWRAPQVERAMAVFDAPGFASRWWQRQAEALMHSDLDALARATTLLEAVDRLRPGGLVECRVLLGEERWDIWVDTERRLPIAARRR